MAVAEFSKMVMGDPDYQARCRQQLQGKNLMCFCKPEDPCHADVLLEVANSLSMTPSEQMAVVQDGGSDSPDAKGDYQSKEVRHDLLTVEELKSRIDDHGNDDPVEESPQDRQAENNDEHRDGSSFDDGLRAISHVTPTGDQSHYDTESADLFLELLGFGLRDPVILSAGGKDPKDKSKDTFWRIPRKPSNGYDWEHVTQQAKQGRDWPGFTRLLKRLPNACFQSCIGGTTNDEITGGWLLVYEIDKYPKDQQYGLWEKAGLPEPTLVMDTGNDSLHVWYRLDAHYESEDISDGRERLAAAINDVLPDGVTCDEKVCLPHQPMRLAGFPHNKSGMLSKVVLQTGNVYRLMELMDYCPPLEDKTPQGRSDERNLFHPNDEGEEILKLGAYPSPADLKGAAVPLDLAISTKTRTKISDGQRSGESEHRFAAAYRISRSLQAAKRAIEHLGYPVAGDPLELFEDFCLNSKCERGYLGKFSELHQCAAHFETSEHKFGPAELSSNALKRRIAKWATKAGRWCPGEITSHHIRDASLQRKLAFFKRYVARCVREHRNSLRRNVYIRDVLDKLKLKSRFKDKDITELVLATQADNSGETFKPLSANDRRNMVRPKVEWLIPDCIPQGDLTIICGRAKVGKTILVMDLIRCLLTGDQFLGFPGAGLHKVLLASDDQGDGDTADMLDRLKIWDHPNLLWSSKFRVTEDQLDQLLQTIEQNPGLVVVVDSLRSVTRSMDCSESDSSLGLVLYDIKSAVVAAGGTLVLIHHANKMNDAVGMEAMSGHNSIAGAGNGVLSLSYLPKPDGKGLQKGIPERRMVREARSGPPCDLVVTIGPSGRFSRVNTFEEFEHLADQAANRNDLNGVPQVVKDSLVNMLDRYDNGAGATAILPLLRETGHCDAAVKVKADLDSTTKYTSLYRHLTTLNDKGVVDVVLESGGFSSQKNQQGWKLTEEGAEMVRDVLAA
jgi:hypothetical protein